jgi:hypothetical protein
VNKTKLPHELSLQELLSAVHSQEQPEVVQETASDSSIMSFIQVFNILPGKSRVTESTLHKLFNLWNRGTPVARHEFNERLGKLLPWKVQSGKKFYLVSKNVLQLSKYIQTIEKNRTQERAKSKYWQNHFTKFLNDTEIEPGTLYIEADVFFYAYNRWCDDTRKTKKLGFENFVEVCQLIFTSKRLSLSNFIWFGVNQKIKSLITREAVQRWREGRHRKSNDKNIDYNKAQKKYEKEVLYSSKEKKQKKPK